MGVEDERSVKNRETALGCRNVRKIRHGGVTSGQREEEKCEEESTKRGGE